MNKRARGPREWSPRKKPLMVEGFEPGNYYWLKFLREIKSEKDFPKNPDFVVNAELAVKLGDLMELYDIMSVRHYREYEHAVAQLLWFPKYRRGGITLPKKMDAKWTDAADTLEVLERWTEGQMTDDWKED
jgi:hypothetical protein